jgi:hypothetical protein
MAHRGRRPRRPSKNPDRPENLQDLAGRLGISYDRARRLRQDGLKVGPDGGYDLDEAMEFDEARRARSPGLESEMAITWNEELKKIRTQILRRDLAKSLELLVDVDEAKRRWRTRMVQIKNRLKALGRELAPRLAHRGPQEVQAIIDERIMEILRELAHERFLPDADITA